MPVSAQKPNTAILWNGFHYKWNHFPHRLSILGTGFEYDSDNTVMHRWRLKIGNFPKEQASFEIPYTLVTTSEFFIGQGETDYLEVKGPIGKNAELNAKLEININELNFRNRQWQNEDSIHVLFNGFELESVNNPSGWHFGALAMKVGETRKISEESLQLDLRLMIRPSLSPEPVSHGNETWSSTDDCVYRVKVRYTVIAGDVHHKSTLFNDQMAKPSNFHQVVHDVDTAEGYEHQIWGISAFSLEIQPPDYAMRPERTGRYIREMGVYLDHADKPTKVVQVFSNQPGLTASKWLMQSSVKVKTLFFNGKADIHPGVLKRKPSTHYITDIHPVEIRKEPVR